jgi:O-acetyl-ADP-ribose deacetylase (regulator of RNase III)
MLAKFTGVEIDFEGAEAHYRGFTLRVIHGKFSVAFPAPTQGCLQIFLVLN